MKDYLQTLKRIDDILESDAAFNSDVVMSDIAQKKPVTKREWALAKVVTEIYKIVHPIFSTCKHPDQEEGVKDVDEIEKEFDERFVKTHYPFLGASHNYWKTLEVDAEMQEMEMISRVKSFLRYAIGEALQTPCPSCHKPWKEHECPKPSNVEKAFDGMMGKPIEQLRAVAEIIKERNTPV